MKTEKEIREEIKNITDLNKNILESPKPKRLLYGDVFIRQYFTIQVLDVLYWILGEERPKFKCDN